MNPGIILLLVALLPALAPRGAFAEPFGAGRPFDQRMVADVFSAAFAFMAPRTLEAVPLPNLALWALGGLTTLDPRLQPELKDGALRLVAPGQVLQALEAPPADDARGWGNAAAHIIRAGWDASEAIRRAGQQGLIRTLFDELFNHFDPYSRYAPPEEAAAERLRRTGKGGIGAVFALRGGGFVAQSVVADGPAAQGGVRPGDRLLGVDGQTTQGAALADVEALIGGPEGTRVVLSLRGHDGTQREVEIMRAQILPPTVSAEWSGDMLVLHVAGFSRDTAERIAQALETGMAAPRPPRGIVLDLRGNRGGLLRQAVAAAEVILPRGTVALTAGRDERANHSFEADGTDLSGGLPAVVLVDGRSASAAEILAAALADQHRAVVVGSATLGKGLVQSIAPLPDGGELLITWSRVLAPLGWPIQGLGVLPQVCTSIGEQALRHQLDHLSHGVQDMANALARHRDARAPISAADILEIRNACPAAESRDLDLFAARRLLHDAPAYAAALLGPPPPAHTTGAARDLTAGTAMRN